MINLLFSYEHHGFILSKIISLEINYINIFSNCQIFELKKTELN